MSHNVHCAVCVAEGRASEVVGKGRYSCRTCGKQQCKQNVGNYLTICRGCSITKHICMVCGVSLSDPLVVALDRTFQ